MSGELWQGLLQVGKEVTAGTPVAATRKLYAMDPKLTRVRAPRPRKFMTGTRDNQRAFTLGPEEDGGSLSLPLSADELIEWLLAGVQGNVVPVGQGTGVAEVQSLADTGASSGTFTLTYAGQTTAPIAYNAAAAAVQTALQALSNIGAGNITASGGPLPSAVTLTFAGTLAKGAQPLITGTSTSLVGGTAVITRTTPGSSQASLWTFKPSTGIDSLTLEWQDGANPWQEAGVRVNKLEFKGSANGDNTVDVDLFGMGLVAHALTASLADRTPTFIEGWETKLYVDPAGTAPGTTPMPAELINWDLTVENGLGRKYFANNTLQTGGVTFGELAVSAKLTIEAANAQALTEFSNWDGAVERVVRLEFGQNSTIASTFKRFVTVDIPGFWSAFDLTQSDQGTRVYALGMDYVYDATLGYGLQVRAQNNRSVAY